MDAKFSQAMNLIPDAIIWFDKEANLVEADFNLKSS